jgi:hypothetical protein
MINKTPKGKLFGMPLEDYGQMVVNTLTSTGKSIYIKNVASFIKNLYELGIGLYFA